MRPMLWILAAGAIAVAACKGKQQPGEHGEAAGQRGTDSTMMGGMPMGGDHMGMGMDSMMPMMRAHMDSMMRMSPEQMSGRMGTHERMMSQMMDRMGADMRGMRMSGDSTWTALTDSVKVDLAELPALQGSKLASRMQAHMARVRRLMALHERMMQGR